jgi:hypothetical protein
VRCSPTSGEDVRENADPRERREDQAVQPLKIRYTRGPIRNTGGPTRGLIRNTRRLLDVREHRYGDVVGQRHQDVRCHQIPEQWYW